MLRYSFFKQFSCDSKRQVNKHKQCCLWKNIKGFLTVPREFNMGILRWQTSVQYISGPPYLKSAMLEDQFPLTYQHPLLCTLQWTYADPFRSSLQSSICVHMSACKLKTYMTWEKYCEFPNFSHTHVTRFLSGHSNDWMGDSKPTGSERNLKTVFAVKVCMTLQRSQSSLTSLEKDRWCTQCDHICRWNISVFALD